MLPAIKKDKKSTLGIFAIILIFIILIAIYKVAWNYLGKIFYDALAIKDAIKIIQLLLISLFVAILHSVILSEEDYLKKKLFIKFRELLYDYYGVKALKNPSCSVTCQRMSQDLHQLARISINTLLTFILAAITLPSFIVVLFKITNFWISALCFIYAIVGTYIAKKLGKPIADLDYEQESLEGELRKDLIQTIDQNLNKLPPLNRVIDNYHAIMRKEKILSYFKNIYQELSITFLHIILIPIYITTSMTLGTFHQSVAAFKKVLGSISFFVYQREGIVEIMATVKRVKELGGASK